VNDFLLERPKSLVLLISTLVGVDWYSKLKSEVKKMFFVGTILQPKEPQFHWTTFILYWYYQMESDWQQTKS
jgi:hypothetical protein